MAQLTAEYNILLVQLEYLLKYWIDISIMLKYWIDISNMLFKLQLRVKIKKEKKVWPYGKIIIIE